MDADLVRLVLLISGVLLVAGIYLWDRYKRAAPRAPQARMTPTLGDASDTSDLTDDLPVSGTESRAEPREQPEPQLAMDPGETDEVPEPDRPRRSALDPEPAQVGDWDASPVSDEPQISMDLNFDAHGDGDYLHTDPALLDEVERKIVVMHLAAKGGAFPGPAIEKACASVHMTLGEMSIYHRHDGGNGKVLFSMASMVEPGTFPANDMSKFSSPGLTLFTQLPGPRDGAEIYNEMVSAASELASLLNAELLDEGRNKLTQQMLDHTRESIIEHRQRIKLARSRR